MFQIKVVEKIKTHILYSATFSDNRAVYEIMSKKLVEPERPQMTMAHKHCMPDKATRAKAHTRACARTPNPPIHTRARTHKNM